MIFEEDVRAYEQSAEGIKASQDARANMSWLMANMATLYERWAEKWIVIHECRVYDGFASQSVAQDCIDQPGFEGAVLWHLTCTITVAHTTLARS